MKAARASIKDVAARAGVSWKTVSNVVNDRPVVRPETRERVLRAIDELGYVPNRNGRDLRGGPTRTLALVLPELENPYFARLAQRFQKAARERGYEVSIELSLGSREVERDQIEGRTVRPVDAVIISPAALDATDLVTRVPSLPVVLLGESVPAAGGATHVAIDNAGSAVDVVRHLVAQGVRRPLFLGAEDRGRSTGTDRLAGFRAAARFADLDVGVDRMRAVPVWDRDGGRRAVEAALCDNVEFDAVVAGNDLLAIGALAALRAAGLTVPRDVAVVGWDDVPESAYAVPPLTSVAPDLDALIRAALDAALGSAESDGQGGGRSREVTVPHRLEIRASSNRDRQIASR